jgi:hypothetical protein
MNNAPSTLGKGQQNQPRDWNFKYTIKPRFEGKFWSLYFRVSFKELSKEYAI